METNSKQFNQAVEREAGSLAKKRFMQQLNAARRSIRARVKYEVRNWEDNFRVPCSICGEPMLFSSKDGNWTEKRAVLYEAFKNWFHKTCESKQSLFKTS